MRIQHNIMAMSSYRNYTNNVGAMKKNLEKLSSGYKINRAGDDAAGLAISEKMRAQITGLKQAQANAKSGINLVQTAEGALQEVQDMLNRMVKLAEQSANGTYDDKVDRNQLNKEFTKLKDEINRINSAANFNGKTLFGGGGGGGGDDDALTADDITAPTATTATFADGGASATAKTEFDFAGVKFAKDGQVQVSFGGKNYAVTVTKDMTADKFAEEFVKEYNKDQLEDTTGGAGKFTAAVDGTTKSKVVFTAATANTAVSDATLKTNLAKAPTIGPVTADGNADAAEGPTFTENSTGDKLATVELASLDLSGAKTITADTAAADLDVKVKFTAASAKLEVTVGGKTYEGTVTTGANEDITLKVNGDTAGTFGEIKVKTAATTTNIKPTGGTDIAEKTVGKAAPAADDDDDGNGGGSGGGSFNFQVGDTNDKYNIISVSIKSIATTAINDISENTGKTLDQLDVKTEASAGTALKALKGMVNYISDIRGDLGAVQNRLDHTINNLGVMEENIQDAESTIRDTDIAEEMMAYTKNNILIQSAQAMLAQANQVPQGVLQLLQ